MTIKNEHFIANKWLFQIEEKSPNIFSMSFLNLRLVKGGYEIKSSFACES